MSALGWVSISSWRSVLKLALTTERLESRSMSCISGWTRCVKKKKTWQAFQIDVFVSAMSHVNEKETCITIFHIPTSQSRSRPRRTFEPQQTSIWQSNEMTSQQSAQKQKGKNDHIIALTTTARLVCFALCMCFAMTVSPRRTYNRAAPHHVRPCRARLCHGQPRRPAFFIFYW